MTLMTLSLIISLLVIVMSSINIGLVFGRYLSSK